MPIFLSKKRLFSQKHCAIMSIKKKTWKTPCCHAHIWSKNVNSEKNNTTLWAKEVSRMPFFSDFSRKNYRSYAHILWKNVHSLKNTLLSSLYFVKKTSHSLKNTVLLCHFFQYFHEKPPAVKTIFGQKTSILQGCWFTKFRYMNVGKWTPKLFCKRNVNQ